MSEPHERLNEAMRKRGLWLKKRWVDVAREAEITTSALGGIRRGEYRPSPHTARALEAALEWAPGSIEEIYAGGEPTTLEEAKLSSHRKRASDGETSVDQRKPVRAGDMPLEQQPGESDLEYADRIYAEWVRVRNEDAEADRLRARTIRALLDPRERDAG